MAQRQTIAHQALDEPDVPGLARAILLDPVDRSITRISLPMLAGDGAQLDPVWLAGVLGSKLVAQFNLAPGEVLIAATPTGRAAWQHDADGSIHGCAVAVGYSAVRDAYSDSLLAVDDLAELVTFGDLADIAGLDGDEEEDDHAAALAQ